jgi:hypothetical protein
MFCQNTLHSGHLYLLIDSYILLFELVKFIFEYTFVPTLTDL